MQTFTIEPIGYLVSPYQEKFAIPRQPGLVEAQGYIRLNPSYADPNCFKDIEQFSHLWLQFIFHQTLARGWKPTVRPPRLGGNQRVGVFATRSTHRPNGLGLSVVKNHGIDRIEGELVLRVSGMDMLDGTPIVDIKPYLPYADALDNAMGGYANEKPTLAKVVWSEQVNNQQLALDTETKTLIEQILAQDPRPAYKANRADDKTYHVKIAGYQISFTVVSSQADKLVQICSIAKTP